MTCLFCQMPAADEACLLLTTDHWKLYLSFDQFFLGRCIIPLKRHAGHLSDLSPAEWLELNRVITALEGAIRKAFGATHFNWSCLMNAAYQEPDPQPHVHWHVRPRYAQPVLFDGISFSDSAFGRHYKHGQERVVPQAVRLKIAQRLRECLEEG